MKKKQTNKTDINKATNEVLAELIRQDFIYLQNRGANRKEFIGCITQVIDNMDEYISNQSEG